MKKSFQIIGVLTLLLGSFIYTDKVQTVSKTTDNLLIEIKNQTKNYKTSPIQPIITSDTIIPGKNGKEINITKTYNKMKQIGYFNEKLIVYKPIKPKSQLKDNQNKYIISANQNTKAITLIFKVNQNIEQIIKILNKTNTKATFFIDSTYLENNYNQIIKLIKEGHTIGNLSKSENYSHQDFIWIKTTLSKTTQKNNYCYLENKNKQVLKICANQNSYTIIPTTIKTNPFINTKKSIKNGALISLTTTKQLEKELENIINYIKNKGYKIKPLEKLLQE